MDEPGLFDEYDEQQAGPPEQLPTHKAPSVRLPAPDGREESGPPSLQPDAEDDWREVPQARFLSWSPRMQAAYCAERDERAALEADDMQLARFYLTRAEGYRKDVKA